MTVPRFNQAAIVGGLLCIAAVVSAQELSLEELLPVLKDRAVVMDIVARVVEQNQEESWNSVNSKVTLPGRPVGLKLVGTNVVVVVQFTPYRQRNGHTVLVAQGQIWVDIPNQGIRYQTTLETIPLAFGEPVYFFPLGSADSPDRARIEIQVELRPYEAESSGQVPLQIPGSGTRQDQEPMTGQKVEPPASYERGSSAPR